MTKDPAYTNRFSGKRLSDRQIDELIGLSRGLIADGNVNHSEVEFLQTWLAANMEVVENPIINLLYRRVSEIMADGFADADECSDLFDALHAFVDGDIAPGELLKPSSLPLCKPAPEIRFEGQRYCFTGTFTYGGRKECESAAQSRGATVGGIAQSTNVLVIGSYATEAWKHSSFGNKIMQAVEWRDKGHPISIVSEDHWVRFV